MIATFCLRLAFGLVAVLPLLSPAQVHPRFFRVQFLTALGLLATAGAFSIPSATWPFWLALGLGMTCCFVGSFVWHLNEAPGGRLTLWLTPLAVLGSLVAGAWALGTDDLPARLADDLASAAVLGSATTAMLMGHSYLLAPAMSLTPLMRLLGALGVSLAVRVALACGGLWLWTAQRGTGNLETEMLLWLPVRWALGLLGPMFLGWMAWETARIRSTQSATGILYVVVIVCFLGELTSQLLQVKTGFSL